MYFTEVHKSITQIIQLFCILNLWHNADKATVKETFVKILYSIYLFLFPLSLIFGAISSEYTEESISLAEMAVVTTVLAIKMTFSIWKTQEILQFLDQVCVHSMEDRLEFNSVTNKLDSFMKIMKVFFCTGVSLGVCVSVVPFTGCEKKLFFNIGFPLDHRKSEVAFWIAFVFTFIAVLLYNFSVLFSIIMWYLLLNTSVKYELFENKLRNIRIDGKDKITPSTEKSLNDQDELVAAVKTHQQIIDLTHRLEKFLSAILSIQIITSGICICGSVYTLAFSVNVENVMEYMVYMFMVLYNIVDIFMITYFGNEIKLSSGRFLYCLFESDWIDQPQSYKKCFIIFGERLKRAHDMVILKLYALNLESFTTILKSAYSLFNILKSVK